MNTTQKLTRCALLSALALMLSYIEALIPFFAGMPGVKLGLANIVVLFCLYTLGGKYGFYVNLVRICLAGLLFGSPFSTLYALSGGLLSLGVMLMLKKTGKFSIVGVSMAGGFFHNLGQILVAAAVVQTPQVFYYFPVLIFVGIGTGILNGVIALLVLSRLDKRQV